MKNAAPGEHTRHLIYKISDLLGFSERELHIRLFAEVQRTKNLADVLQDLITYNVPLFVLRQLFPAACETLASGNSTVALAVAEEGWKGRLNNIQSRFAPPERRLEYQKSHVLESEVIVVVSKVEPTGQIALCLSAWPALQNKENREELQIMKSSGQPLRHFRIRGEATVEQSMLVPFRHYQKIALHIPLRELTSMAFLVTALHGKTLAWTSSDLALREAILNCRALNGQLKTVAAAAQVMVKKFARSGIVQGPFWEALFRLFKVT
ncbi:MAG: hypothetical protein HS115_08160 [Spirochaetales bacterium]|nr:hypothetical protein [Spirochaetales bacterium]